LTWYQNAYLFGSCPIFPAHYIVFALTLNKESSLQVFDTIQISARVVTNYQCTFLYMLSMCSWFCTFMFSCWESYRS